MPFIALRLFICIHLSYHVPSEYRCSASKMERMEDKQMCNIREATK